MAELDVKNTDNSAAVQAELTKAIERALESVGMAAQAYATLLCRVDTGRLRNSITYSTAKTRSGGNNKQSGAKASSGDVTPYGSAANNEIWLGTNVEYARKVEQNVKEFIGPALKNHIDEYKRIFEQELGSLSGGD